MPMKPVRLCRLRNSFRRRERNGRVPSRIRFVNRLGLMRTRRDRRCRVRAPLPKTARVLR